MTVATEQKKATMSELSTKKGGAGWNTRRWTATLLLVVAAAFGGLFVAANSAAAAERAPSEHACCESTAHEHESCTPALHCGAIQMPHDCPCRIEPADDVPVGHILALSDTTITYGAPVAPQSTPQVAIPLPRASGLVPSAEHLHPFPPSQPLYILNSIFLI